MAFPETSRIEYDKNPLQIVGCQLSFPPILRIDTEIPVKFHELVRDQYPFVEESHSLDMPPDIPPEVSKAIAEEASHGLSSTTYEFRSTDEKWVATLTRDALLLVALDYENWEGFKEHLQGLFGALVEVYSPSFFTIVRLTYTNVIEKSELGLKDAEWSELLEPFIAGELASDVAGQVRGVRSEVHIELDHMDGMDRLRHGTVQKEESTEVGYLIENDFYREERTEIDEAAGILEFFNQQAGRAFRWCIKARLHKALGPQPG